jgi:hypothetical protein
LGPFHSLARIPLSLSSSGPAHPGPVPLHPTFSFLRTEQKGDSDLPVPCSRSIEPGAPDGAPYLAPLAVLTSSAPRPANPRPPFSPPPFPPHPLSVLPHTGAMAASELRSAALRRPRAKLRRGTAPPPSSSSSPSTGRAGAAPGRRHRLHLLPPGVHRQDRRRARSSPLTASFPGPETTSNRSRVYPSPVSPTFPVRFISVCTES